MIPPAGRPFSMDMYRNSLILWNAGMQEPVIVDKACCSVDVLPSLLNLFGFDYDSRMYAGRDIFSGRAFNLHSRTAGQCHNSCCAGCRR